MQNNIVSQYELDVTQVTVEELYNLVKENFNEGVSSFTLGEFEFVHLDSYMKLSRRFDKLKDKIEKMELRDESRMRDILELKNTINAYKRHYGDYTSPFDVLKALFRGDKNKEYLDTLSILNPKKDLGFNSKSVEHWLSVFEELGIIKRIDRGRYMSLLSIKEASSILQDFVNKV